MESNADELMHKLIESLQNVEESMGPIRKISRYSDYMARVSQRINSMIVNLACLRNQEIMICEECKMAIMQEELIKWFENSDTNNKMKILHKGCLVDIFLEKEYEANNKNN